MPLPLMVRIDDEWADQLREEANRTHAPMNRIINDALKARYTAGFDDSGAPRKTPHIVATFGERLQQARDAFRAREHQENPTDYRAADEEFGRLLLDCITALMVAQDPSIAPTVSPSREQEVHA
jgi:hypothetical protein